MSLRLRSVVTLVLLLGTLLASSSCAQTPAPAATPAVLPPLARFSDQVVLVLPSRHLATGDSLGWSAGVGDAAAFLRQLDAELVFALGERSLGASWIFPERLATAARRSAGLAPDPYTVDASGLRPPVPRRGPPDLHEPLGSQLRALAALTDARYALIPVELRFERTGVDRGRALLHVVLADVRLAQAVWRGDVASDPATTFSPALAASLAARLTDLIAAP